MIIFSDFTIIVIILALTVPLKSTWRKVTKESPERTKYRWSSARAKDRGPTASQSKWNAEAV